MAARLAGANETHPPENGTVNPGAGNLRISRRALLGATAALSAASFCRSTTGLAAPTAPAASGPHPALRRGGSIHTMLNWPELARGNKDQIAWPPFTAAKYQPDPATLKGLRRAGLDHIRLTIDPGLLLSVHRDMRQSALDIIISRCRLLLGHGFSVIADFHPINQIAAFAPDRIITSETLFSAYTANLALTAKAMRALDPARVALEVMNEPPYGYDLITSRRWTAMLHRMHKAIRAENPALPLVMSGAAGGGIPGLMNIDARAFSDPNIFWSFHYYDPHLFTHQGVATSQSNMLWYRYLTDVPYPARRGNAGLVNEALHQNMRLDRTLDRNAHAKMEREFATAIKAYFNTNFGPASIAADFERVTNWARANAIPAHRIYLGEFGAARRNPQGNGASETHRREWMRDIRLEAEKREFAWSLWDVNAPQMGLMDPRGAALDRSMLDALGLQSAAG